MPERSENPSKSDVSTQRFVVSHAEREFALNLLREAMGQGYVSADEIQRAV